MLSEVLPRHLVLTLSSLPVVFSRILELWDLRAVLPLLSGLIMV